MGSHVSVTFPTEFSASRGAWRHALAPKAAGATCPCAHIRPRVQAASHLAQPCTICYQILLLSVTEANLSEIITSKERYASREQ